MHGLKHALRPSLVLCLVASTNAFRLPPARTLWTNSSSRGVRVMVNHVGLVPDGVVAINKPPDWTSADVVSKVKGTLQRFVRAETGEKVWIKVGHGGTLDPMATGVLVLGIGSGCKALESYLKGKKAYSAVGVLGSEMDTGDRTGQVVEEMNPSAVTLEDLQQKLPDFIGDIMQVPPIFSALKKDGKRAYERARKGEKVEMEERPVKVYSLEAWAKDDVSLPKFGLEIECGGGTYVRSLIQDLGRAVGNRAHMVDLVRTRQGPFTLEHCLDAAKMGDHEAILEQTKYCTNIALEAAQKEEVV